MANIFTRSPHIIEINEASQVRTKVELFISSGKIQFHQHQLIH